MTRVLIGALVLTTALAACGGGSGSDVTDATRDAADALDLPDVPEDVPAVDAPSDAPAPDAPDVPDATLPCAPYEGFGPFVVGVRTLSLPDRKVEVWYPAVAGSQIGKARDRYDIREWLPPAEVAKIAADAPTFFETEAYRDLDAAPGPFPLALFSHGVASFRDQSSALTAHLASWGFVVAAPDHLERGLEAFVAENPVFDALGDVDLRATIDLLKVQAAVADGPFEGRLDFTRIVATGHSMGGAAVLKLMESEDVLAGVTWAGASAKQAGIPVTKPLLQISGSNDGIAPPGDSRATFDSIEAWPKGFAEILGAGHLAFSDLCVIGAEQGGVVALALSLGVTVPDLLVLLGSDGCQPTDLPAVQAWPIIRNYTVAHLRLALHIDATPVGLDDAAKACFAARLVDAGYETQAPAVPETADN
jgi:predicted dienelactone hydrolase